jgi:acetate kinase
MTAPDDSPKRSLIVFNVGSSSLKYQSFALDGSRVGATLAHGRFDRQASVGGTGEPSPADAALLAEALAEAERRAPDRPICAAGHRVVHGGRAFSKSVLIDAAGIEKIAALSDLAPLHQPHNLMAIRALAKLRPGLLQVAAFDTAFHRTMPMEARRLPLPDWAFEAGIERYGFHGLSYAWIVEALRARPGGLPRRVLAFHLGAGASACAILEGRSVDTSMSFSTLDGLMMASRPGALDPGVLLHLMRAKGMDEGQLTTLLYSQSGLAGVSGATGDMKKLLASSDEAARLAVALYCRRAAQIGAGYAAILGGLDAIVFTGGVGENAAPIRSRIAQYFAHLGLSLDKAANEAGRETISAAESAIAAFVLPANEERIIAQETAALLRII